MGVLARLFDPQMQERRRLDVMLDTDLREAIDSDQLIPYFQPQVDVETGAVSGVEALVRWPHPRLGFVTPADFIPLAEKSGLIVPLGELMLERAVSAFAGWRSAGLSIDEVSVNVSPLQLRVSGFADLVACVLNRYGLPPESLVLEITESAALDPGAAAQESLNGLRALGVTLAIDDFGTGHANLSNIAGLPVGKVKLDRSLIPTDSLDSRAGRVFANVVTLVLELGFGVVAEGVETAAQVSIAHDAGCRYIQGYFYSPPVRAKHIETLLRDGLTGRRA